MRLPRSGRAFLVVALALLGAAGCKEMLKDGDPPAVVVQGSIRAGTIPIGGGWIEFWPTEGTVGPLRSSPIAGDGSFAPVALTPGRRLVRLVRSSPAGPLPLIHQALFERSQRLDSPLRAAIPEAASFRLDIDLATQDIQ